MSRWIYTVTILLIGSPLFSQIHFSNITDVLKYADKNSTVSRQGVMFGISMFIIMISFMTGVNNFMEDMAMDGSPHVRIYNPLQVKDEKIIAEAAKDKEGWFVVHHQRPKNDLSKIKNALFLADEMEKLPQVEGVAPQVATQVFFDNGPIQISGTMSGIDVQKQKELFNLETKMDEGSLDNLLTSSDAIVMGKGLAEKVNVQLGDRVSVTTPEGNNLVLKVVGIFSYGMAAFDDAKSYASIATVQKILMRDPSYITDLHVKLKDINEARPFANTIHQQLTVYAEDWETANSFCYFQHFGQFNLDYRLIKWLGAKHKINGTREATRKLINIMKEQPQMFYHREKGYCYRY
jgi:lipoprotein-releasing system permease protein